MKVLVIGDVHGSPNWKSAVTAQSPDKTIFIGDYFDSLDIGFTRQLDNFRDILEYSKNNDTVLLLGNHDLQYFPFTRERVSGHQAKYHFIIQEAFGEVYSYKVVHLEDNICFSHAGITNTFLGNLPLGNINELFYTKPRRFEFKDHPGSNPYGDNTYQSPIWVRPNSLLEDKIPNYIQVVGHTTQEHIKEEDGVWFIDCWSEYIVIMDGAFNIEKY